MSPASAPRRSSPASVTIVMPAKDEAAAIGRTLSALPRATLRTMGLDIDVVVLDGGSRDATADIARRHGATVIPDREPGKAAALRHARDQLRGDHVVMLDADGTYAADAIPRVLAPLLRDEADVVMGRRVVRPGAMRRRHRAGNVMLSAGASVLYGRPCPDLCTGLWGFRAPVLRALPLRGRGFELEAELFALSARLDLRIAAVPADYLPRDGEAKLSWARDGARIGWWLLRSRFVSLPAHAENGTGRNPTPRNVTP